MSENPGECACCRFQTHELQLFKAVETTIGGGGKTVRADFWYCDLCCSTIASSLDRYPNQTPSNTEILRTICYVGNVILEALNSRSGD